MRMLPSQMLCLHRGQACSYRKRNDALAVVQRPIAIGTRLTTAGTSPCHVTQKEYTEYLALHSKGGIHDLDEWKHNGQDVDVHHCEYNEQEDGHDDRYEQHDQYGHVKSDVEAEARRKRFIAEDHCEGASLSPGRCADSELVRHPTFRAAQAAAITPGTNLWEQADCGITRGSLGKDVGTCLSRDPTVYGSAQRCLHSSGPPSSCLEVRFLSLHLRCRR